MGDGEEEGNRYRMRYNFRHTQLEKLNRMTAASTDENTEKEEVSYIAGRNTNLYIYLREQCGKISS